MNRKQFIEANGGTCANWTWSWSFVNEEDRFVIFGAWDVYTEGENALILSEDWETRKNGRKQPAYSQAVDHLRLVEQEGYDLKIFNMTFARTEEGGPAKIDGFEPVLFDRNLIKTLGKWYASSEKPTLRISEEVETPEKYIEGASRKVSVNTYERSAKARKACLDHHGYSCTVCRFSFEEMYGEIGKDYIHVHHVIPISELKQEYELDPIKDLVPVCPNCHAIIHRFQPALSIAEMRKVFQVKR